MKVAVGLVLNATAERIAAERIIALLRANDEQPAEDPAPEAQPEKKKPTEKKPPKKKTEKAE